MKQFIFSLLLLASIGSLAQIKLGLKLAPIVTANRAKNDAQTVENDGTKMKFSVGLIADQALSDTYYLSTGLVYLPKRAAFRSADNTLEEEYKLQYLQIPATLKLFTNEMAPDLKAFLLIGSGLEIKVFDEAGDPSYDTVESFTPIDIPVILGGGVEFRAGINTTLFGGFSYQRGLVNTVNEAAAGNEDLQILNTIFSIDFGVKF
ncbi:Outer membrane protein beta-barrel domain-containing protein [Ekhidna lutea]|uniref:Outer membrane protein beta-barrel domain-containing protein n=1 Tax=Ekhidna lutea TaxID=447679 RepID=A0A239EVX7_EKHLU|nr:outer membrane beta-barrel protein [Ekhidna lutea]SNS48769.1 Outer membrane protein beta-barrel domain-containing protein [Ekhidna lutea]